jgi:glycosyltransferase involved in cell wall biosynthesis
LNHRDPKHPNAGGAERTIYEVAKRLVEQGNEVTLYCPKWKGSSSQEMLDGIRIVRKGNNFSTHIILPVFLLRNKFDIVVNDLAHGIPWISSVLLEERNLVFFRHLHARSLPGQVNFILAKVIISMEKAYRLIYKNIKVVTESSTSEEDLLNLGFLQENIVKIPPGVDLITFSPGEKTKNVPNFDIIKN